MKFYLWISALLLVVIGTNSQDGFDLSFALDDDPTVPPPPPKAEEPKPNPKDDGGLDLLDAFGFDDPTKAPPKAPPKKPAAGDGGLDLGDALGGPDPTPAKPRPPKPGGGGGSFDDSDLWDPDKGDIDKPQGGGGGGGYDSNGGGGGGGGGSSDQTKEAGGGQIAGIASAIGVALMGAASGYIAYQKKKLCFKLQGGADPESGKNHQGGNRGGQSQLFSNLLRST